MPLAEVGIGLAGLALALVSYAVAQARSSEHRLSVLETKIGLFWQIIEKGAVDLLHRDDAPATDKLLERAASNKLTEEERMELVRRLKAIETDPKRSPGESTAALLMRAVLVAKFYNLK